MADNICYITSEFVIMSPILLNSEFTSIPAANALSKPVSITGVV